MIGVYIYLGIDWEEIIARRWFHCLEVVIISCKLDFLMFRKISEECQKFTQLDEQMLFPLLIFLFWIDFLKKYGSCVTVQSD